MTCRHPRTLPMPAIELNPIGSVVCTVPDDEIGRRRRTLESTIVIADHYRDALLGIEQYSHLIVLFWMHRVTEAPPMQVHPRGDATLPLTGVLASRGRGHPNPIGLAVVELVTVDGTRLTVRRLDAYDGTPVVDIKPYDHYDAYTDIRVPSWFLRRQSGGAKGERGNGA
ncbi:MAG: tRNA (N6-threonylcarbamoyladenosine(37)-N6)-methyltransferase TrmO, partial [Gammaproteobacteria bacterium]